MPEVRSVSARIETTLHPGEQILDRTVGFTDNENDRTWVNLPTMAMLEHLIMHHSEGRNFLIPTCFPRNFSPTNLSTEYSTVYTAVPVYCKYVAVRCALYCVLSM
ncbi:hypothetical protein BDDG_12377 [Blastomyces dermatitidis ATCC 18188]|uniref:Uncharacterized protein n=1 Tax=Ajellomyces dermatitidis (strain ATCC 18188 / CBS 674.68) TaxID=653446 RepID=A0A0J9EP92_AJEDA|nr:hypothetical protein BDFG_03267 [Blastomyces dermatitidis ATCC 26199]KMW67847.1 hypothetical protein BDDG_12377 [Blastomyces dermatitidis ATCC 18188]